MFKKVFLIVLLATTQGYSFCYLDTSCEDALSDMEDYMENVVETNFDKLKKKIDTTKEKYEKINKELDKEIYVLTVTLKGETLLYRKLSEIELYSSESKQLNSIETSLIINITEQVQNKQKKVRNK